MDDSTKQRMLEQIQQNILREGHHVTLVQQSGVPRCAYTIGLADSAAAELILAGAISFMADDVVRLFGELASLPPRRRSVEGTVFLGELGSFELRRVDPSWSRGLMLGAVQQHAGNDFDAVQIVPCAHLLTIDVPDMRRAIETDPLWRLADAAWPYAVPRHATATTNLDALRGHRITEVARWDEDDWEMFAGRGTGGRTGGRPSRAHRDVLTYDPSLMPALDVTIGKGLWRAPESGEWNPWGSSARQAVEDPE